MLLLAQPLPITRTGPSGARRALPTHDSSLLMLSPLAVLPAVLVPGEQLQAPSPSTHRSPQRGAVAEGSHRGPAGDTEQRLPRSDSSSGLGLHTLSILRHLMTNSADKRVFLQSLQPVRRGSWLGAAAWGWAPPWKRETFPRSPNASWPCEMPPHREPHKFPSACSPTGAPHFQGSSAQEGGTTLGLEPRLLGRLVGVSLGGDSVTSGNGSDGKTPAAKTAGYKRLGERERRPGRLPARAEKAPDRAVGTRRGRRTPQDRGGGRCGVSQAASPQPYTHGIASSAPQREDSPRDAWQRLCPDTHPHLPILPQPQGFPDGAAPCPYTGVESPEG